VNMVHTMETLLGLPPMNVNDAYAPVMGALFSGQGDQAPFTADWSNRDNGLLYQTNPPKGPDAEQSLRLDFSRPDAANAEVLNAILWRDRKGDAPLSVQAQRSSSEGNSLHCPTTMVTASRNSAFSE